LGIVPEVSTDIPRLTFVSKMQVIDVMATGHKKELTGNSYDGRGGDYK
jgi:hypothetical protein